MKYVVSFKPQHKTYLLQNKVAAIKEMRIWNGFGLKESKDAVDIIYDKGEVVIDLPDYINPNAAYFNCIPVGQKDTKVERDKTKERIKDVLTSAVVQFTRQGNYQNAEDTLMMLRKLQSWS
jgi:hypothetical protein